MSKTKFINGTPVLTRWLNSIFGGGAKDQWAASTAYVEGDLIEETGTSNVWRCISAGTSGGVEPTWGTPAIRDQVVDGTVTWEHFEGHLHDGRTGANGSAPKVLLTSGTEVSGRLPQAHYVPPRGYIDGFQMSYAQDGDAWDINIGSGVCDDQVLRLYALTGAVMKKRVIGAAGTGYEGWVQGGNNGGVAAGVAAIADGNWLHAFVIGQSGDASAVDYGFDDSISAANLLTGDWNLYRRVGSIRIEDLGGGKFGVDPFLQVGDRFVWEKVHVVTKDDTTSPLTTGVDTAISLSVPPGLVFAAELRMDGAVSDAAAPQQLCNVGVVTSGGQRAAFHLRTLFADVTLRVTETMTCTVVTTTSGQITVYAYNLTDQYTISYRTVGYIDRRGRDA